MVSDVGTGSEFQETTFHLQTTVNTCSLYECHVSEVLRKAKRLDELLYLALSSADRFPVLGQLSAVSVLPVSTAFCKRRFGLMDLVKNRFIP
jgi:hypothetical protein